MAKKKKRILKRLYFLIILLCVVSYLGTHASDIAYNKAMNLYNQKEYEKSLPYFEFTTFMDNDNLDAYYQYAKALNSMPMTFDVQKKLFNLAHSKKSGAAATMANQKLARYRYFILTHAGGNYIQQVSYQDKILHWNPSSFPLKVYIEPYNETSYYVGQVQNAFYSWKYATKNYISFEFVKTPENADIDFRFIKKDNAKESSAGKYVLAYAEPTISGGGKLKKFDIRFSTTDELNRPFSPENIYVTSMHEIGHALGIMGHSFYENNLMYPSSIEDKSIHAKYHTRGITAEDINTLNLLYAMNPDITNVEYHETNLKKLIYAPVILGDKKEINNQKIEQATKYIQNAPGLPNGYMDLASAYYELGNYQESINNLYKALLLTKDANAQYPILYNMTITYFEARDYNNAATYAQKTQNIKNTTEINTLIQYLKFKTGDRKAGIDGLENMLKQEPTNIDIAQYLIRAYLENNQRGKAGDTLKRIKASNPEANKDPRILQFGLLNLIYR